MNKFKLMLLVVAAVITTTLSSCLGSSDDAETMFYGSMTVRHNATINGSTYSIVFYASNGAIFIPTDLTTSDLSTLGAYDRAYVYFTMEDSNVTTTVAGKTYYVSVDSYTPLYGKDVDEIDNAYNDTVVNIADSISSYTAMWVDPGYVNIRATIPYKYGVEPSVYMAYNPDTDIAEDTLKLHFYYKYNIASTEATNMCEDITMSFNFGSYDDLKNKFAAYSNDSIIVSVDANVSTSAGVVNGTVAGTLKKKTYKIPYTWLSNPF